MTSDDEVIRKAHKIDLRFEAGLWLRVLLPQDAFQAIECQVGEHWRDNEFTIDTKNLILASTTAPLSM